MSSGHACTRSTATSCLSSCSRARWDRVCRAGGYPTAAAITAALAMLTVRYPDWGRIDYGEHYFVVTVPPVAPHSAILLLSDQAMAFVLPYFPPDGRFLGADNSFNNPRYHNRLETEVARTVREHSGPLYSLAPSDGVVSAALSAHGLRSIPGGCASIVSNMSPVAFELCLLDRIRSPGQTDGRPQRGGAV